MPELNMWDVLLRPVVTEKSNIQQADENHFTFEVNMRANKLQIRDAVEHIFDVDVLDVRTMVMPAKRGRRGRKFYIRKKTWKKAIITVAPGQTIDVYRN